MVKCKSCGYKNQLYESVCPRCSERINLGASEEKKLLDEARELRESEEHEASAEIYKFLAELGICEGEAEYARICERGLYAPRDTDTAAKYYLSAAKKCDSYSAYRYSRLLPREDEQMSSFWLIYSALLGCAEAYPEVSALYSSLGDRQSASYFSALAAEAGDVDSVIEMAKRHIEGRGAVRNDGYARWYMDKLSVTPIYAKMLTYRLRGASAERPPAPILKKRAKILTSMINDARKYGIPSAVMRLSEIFAATDEPDALVNLGLMYLDGIECERNVEKGIAHLEKAMREGSSLGAKYLGDLFSAGKLVERDKARAVKYYMRSAETANEETLAALGDIFFDGRVTEPDPEFAIELYKKGERLGDKKCKRKLEAIKEEREKRYLDGCRIEESSPEEAYVFFKMSAAMGHISAHKKVARHYEYGIGTQVNRRAAFNHYKTAADGGDTGALYDLGRCYARGIGTAFDFTLASKTLTKAMHAGSREADRELRRIYENKKKHMVRSLYSTAMRLLYIKKRDVAKKMLETCATLGAPEAIYAIGCLHEFGLGFAANRKLAMSLYSKAYSKGFSDPDKNCKQKILKMAR